MKSIDLQLSTDLVSFTNEITVGHDGWAQLAPFGDYPGEALLRQADGSLKKFPALQRLDRATAEAMVAKFKSPIQRLKRFVSGALSTINSPTINYSTGCPIYAGHPDAPGFAHVYKDKTPKGMIVDLAVRPDGLFCKPVFTNEGSELVETKTFRAFSAYWSAVEIPNTKTLTGANRENRAGEGNSSAAAPSVASVSKSPLKIYRPDVLKSAGLTNHPNLPVHLLNEAQTQHPITPSIQSNIPMNKSLLIPILAQHGLEVPESAPDESFAAAFQTLGDRVTSVATLANEIVSQNSKIEALAAAFTNERRHRIESLLAIALTEGRITAAERADWENRLGVEANFANESAALARVGVKIKTSSITARSGERKVEIANVAQRSETIRDLVAAEMNANGGDYDRAYQTVRRANPALFQAMKQPTSNR